jgi:hypothetical protein
MFYLIFKFCSFRGVSNVIRGSLLSWSYGSWIYNYICHQSQSPLKLWTSLCKIVRSSVILLLPLFSVNQIKCRWLKRWLFYGKLRHIYPNAHTTSMRPKNTVTFYNYICNQSLSPLKLWVQVSLMARCTQYNIMW